MLYSKKGRTFVRPFCIFSLAEWTGLEPATPGVTGRYSNRLNYHSLVLLDDACCCISLVVSAERLELPTYAL